MGQRTTHHTSVVELHELSTSSSLRLEEHHQAVHSSVDTQQFDAKVPGKCRKSLAEVFAQALLAANRSRRLAQQLLDQEGPEFDIFRVVSQKRVEIAPIPG